MNFEQKLNKEISTVVRSGNRPGRSLKTSEKVSYREFLSDKMLVIAAIRAGIPYSLFALIKEITPFSEDDWAEILNISTKSLSRYKQASRHFKPLQSEKIVEMAEISEAGKDVFGSVDKFRLWLDTPNFALGGAKPFDLLKDSYGKELVLSELVRVEHGILA